jgi:hypothetical protein
VYASTLLHNHLSKSCQSIHRNRLQCLMVGVDALLHGNKLSVTGLGRAVKSNVATKHTIKQMDRLTGNELLHADRHAIYSSLLQWILSKQQRPQIIIDWSGLSHCGLYHFLRASVVAKGRAITIYEEAHHEADKTNMLVHRKFLVQLKKMLPKTCKPIIITDAGFRNPWFKEIERLEWDWIGRVRHLTLYKQGEADWQSCKTLYSQATTKASYVGEVTLAKSNALLCHFYLIKQNKKHRLHCNLRGHKSRCSVSLKHAKRENEPWLIATSLSAKDYTPKQIMAIYANRMQIEEAIRDLKNQRTGFSLRESRTRSIVRFENLLLIATLATFVLWLIGLIAHNLQLQRQFQANTYRDKRVLSFVYLGKEVLKKMPYVINKKSVIHAQHCLLILLQESSCVQN